MGTTVGSIMMGLDVGDSDDVGSLNAIIVEPCHE
jgi:hypothetical protein